MVNPKKNERHVSNTRIACIIATQLVEDGVLFQHTATPIDENTTQHTFRIMEEDPQYYLIRVDSAIHYWTKGDGKFQVNPISIDGPEDSYPQGG